jgi:hypothetical protein
MAEICNVYGIYEYVEYTVSLSPELAMSCIGIMPDDSFLWMAIWLRGLECWYLVLGGVAVGRGFEPQSDLELSFSEILT